MVKSWVLEMKKKKFLLILITIILVVTASFTIFFVVNKEDKNTTLTILEKQWIDSNKNTRFDFSIVKDIPGFSYEGEGIFLDFLDSTEKVTGLDFNLISSKLGSQMTTDYGFNIVDTLSQNDILIYEDNYVIVSNKGVRYENLSQLDGLVIGALNKEVSTIDFYLKGANVTYKTCDEVQGLFDAIENDPQNNIVPVVDAIVIPKNIYIDRVIEYKDFDISYNITEISKKYVLTLGDNEKLNNILKKYYEKWSIENFDTKFSEHLLNLYYENNNIDEKKKVEFKSKRYIYGYVDNAPFDFENSGINHLLINKFIDFSDIEVEFKKYNSYDDLINAFNENKVDFMFNNLANTEYKMDIFNTISIYDENLVIIAKNSNDVVINSINSLANNQVNTLENTKIESYFKTQDFSYNAYKNVEQLINNSGDNDLLVVDYYTYKYYVNSYFKNYEIKLFFNLTNDYNFIIRDIKENEIFENLFNFYLSYTNDKKIVSDYYYEVSSNPIKNDNSKIILIVLIPTILLIVLISIFKMIKSKKNPHSNLSKEDKLRYIDMLTSLKNRNYLNDNIEKWDSSEVYPQSIIIADLNNVAYINDNYGHNEGDSLIKEAANILIKNQIANSEIIRTNGNEFLIYLVGYDEKQIVSYVKKLNKEFKELAHGFGVATGYSMINDAIKTIDDAINEATLEMRNNKEEANN